MKLCDTAPGLLLGHSLIFCFDCSVLNSLLCKLEVPMPHQPVGLRGHLLTNRGEEEEGEQLGEEVLM